MSAEGGMGDVLDMVSFTGEFPRVGCSVCKGHHYGVPKAVYV